jgi:hypothetical protein
MARRNSALELPPSQRRLQRPPDFTGARLSSFAQVAWRHGLTGAALAGVCLLVPDMRALLVNGLAALTAQPAVYLTRALVVGAALVAYTAWLERRVEAASAGWVFYLLAVSIWEEWVFRLAVPYFATGHGLALPLAAGLSNLVFGGLHYFSLRWKWQWCVLAGLGGMGLSRQLGLHGDLALVIGVHWVATVINTPRVPGRSRRAATDGSVD